MDAIASAPEIFRNLEAALQKDDLENLFQPLSPQDERQADYTSIRVKSKFGCIQNHFAFRIYAVKVDDGCYVITGGAIKITRGMSEAPHTKIELDKLNYVHDALLEEGLTDKVSFLDYIF